MGWGGVDNLHLAAAQGLQGQPLPVQLQVAELHVVPVVDLGQLPIARILNAVDPIPPQKLDQKLVQVLGSRADDDLLRRHRHSPETV